MAPRGQNPKNVPWAVAPELRPSRRPRPFSDHGHLARRIARIFTVRFCQQSTQTRASTCTTSTPTFLNYSKRPVRATRREQMSRKVFPWAVAVRGCSWERVGRSWKRVGHFPNPENRGSNQGSTKESTQARANTQGTHPAQRKQVS